MKNKEHISLETIGKELPFSTPDGYFENFAAQFEQQIQTKRTEHRSFFRPWMYAAAIFVVVVVVGKITYSVNQSNITSSDTYESYVLSQVDESALMDYYVEDAAK